MTNESVYDIIEHTTKQQKVIRGVVITTADREAVMAIDPYTFRKGSNGWFVRERHIESLIAAGIEIPARAAPANSPTAAPAAAAIVEAVSKSINATLSPWELPREEGPNSWRYTNLVRDEKALRIGVSSGGVIAIDGHPFTPKESGARLILNQEDFERAVIAALPKPEDQVANLFGRGDIEGAYAVRRTLPNPVPFGDINGFVREQFQKESTPLWWLPAKVVQGWTDGVFAAVKSAVPESRQIGLQALRYSASLGSNISPDVSEARHFEFNEEVNKTILDWRDVPLNEKARYSALQERMDNLEKNTLLLDTKARALLSGYKASTNSENDMPQWIKDFTGDDGFDIRGEWLRGQEASTIFTRTQSPTANPIQSAYYRDMAVDIINAELKLRGFTGSLDPSTGRVELEKPAPYDGVFNIEWESWLRNDPLISQVDVLERNFERFHIVVNYKAIIDTPKLLQEFQPQINAMLAFQYADAIKILLSKGYTTDTVAVDVASASGTWLRSPVKDSPPVFLVYGGEVATNENNTVKELAFRIGTEEFTVAPALTGTSTADAIDYAIFSNAVQAAQAVQVDPDLTGQKRTLEQALQQTQAFELGIAHPVSRLEDLKSPPPELAMTALNLAGIEPASVKRAFDYGRAFSIHKMYGAITDLAAYGLADAQAELVADVLTVGGIPSSFDTEDRVVMFSLNNKTLPMPTHHFNTNEVRLPNDIVERELSGLVFRLSTPPVFSEGNYPWQVSLDAYRERCNQALGEALAYATESTKNLYYREMAYRAIDVAIEKGHEFPNQREFAQNFITPIWADEVKNFCTDLIRGIEIKPALDGQWMVVDIEGNDGALGEYSGRTILKTPYKQEAVDFYNTYRYSASHAPEVVTTPTTVQVMPAVEITAEQPDNYLFSGEAVQQTPRESGETVSTGRNKTNHKIQDFGEHIPGAKKELAAAFKKRLVDATEYSLVDHPLAKTWPEPNYAGLVADGMDPFVIGWIRASRDEVGSKPRGWKLRGWVESVTKLRDSAVKLMTGELQKEKLIEKLDTPEYEKLKNSVGFRAELYAEKGHEKSFKDIQLRSHNYSLYQGVTYNPSKQLWSVEHTTKTSGFGNWPKTFAVGETREEAINKFYEELAAGAPINEEVTKKPSDPAKGFDLYYTTGKERVWFFTKKIGSHAPQLITFASKDEAKEWRARPESTEELIALYQDYKNIPDERREVNEKRDGPDYRYGVDVTIERFQEEFGFRGVQFGNYVNNAERQEFLNQTYDAFMDLATLINIPPKAISLNGELALAFGARGSGGRNPAAAHYERTETVINLTRFNGAGSLAHEWWHSVDNYFQRKAGDRLGYTTDRREIKGSKDGNPYSLSNDGLRQELLTSLKGVVNAIKETRLLERSNSLDKRRSKPYWGTVIEATARSFEAFVIAKLAEKNISNDFLANIQTEEGYRKPDMYPYPLKNELPKIAQAYENVFSVIQVEQNANKALMFSRTDEFVGENTAIKYHDLVAIADAVKAQESWSPDMEINIVKNWEDLPRDIVDEIRDRSAYDMAGSYHKAQGNIWLVADNIKNADHALFTILHEGCHKGISILLGDQTESIMLDIYKTNPDIKTFADKLMNKYHDLSTATATEECLANLAGNQSWESLKGWDKIVATTRDLVRSVASVLPPSLAAKLSPSAWTTNDVILLTHKAAESLKTTHEIQRTYAFQPSIMMSRGNADTLTTDLPKKHWAIIKDSKIVTSGNSVGMDTEYLSNLAKLHAADGVVFADVSLSKSAGGLRDEAFGYSWEEINRAHKDGTLFNPTQLRDEIFGYSWEEICRAQQGGTLHTSTEIRLLTPDELDNMVPINALPDADEISHRLKKMESEASGSSPTPGITMR